MSVDDDTTQRESSQAPPKAPEPEPIYVSFSTLTGKVRSGLYTAGEIGGFHRLLVGIVRSLGAIPVPGLHLLAWSRDQAPETQIEPRR